MNRASKPYSCRIWSARGRALPAAARRRAAALAVEVLALAGADQGVQARPVAEVDVLDDAVRLERLEVAVDRRRVEPEPVGELLGRDRPVGLEERLEHEPPRRREPQAALAQDAATASSRSVNASGRTRGASVIAAKTYTRVFSWALQRSSMWPKCQTASDTAQVATNIPTITNPSVLRSMFSTHTQNDPLAFRCWANDAGQLDRPDDERDHHREAGDGDVVVDLAHRLARTPSRRRSS